MHMHCIIQIKVTQIEADYASMEKSYMKSKNELESQCEKLTTQNLHLQDKYVVASGFFISNVCVSYCVLLCHADVLVILSQNTVCLVKQCCYITHILSWRLKLDIQMWFRFIRNFYHANCFYSFEKINSWFSETSLYIK